MLADALLQRVDTPAELARVICCDDFLEDRPRMRGAVCNVRSRFVIVGCGSDVGFGGFDEVLSNMTHVSISAISIRRLSRIGHWKKKIREMRR